MFSNHLQVIFIHLLLLASTALALPIIGGVDNDSEELVGQHRDHPLVIVKQVNHIPESYRLKFQEEEQQETNAILRRLPRFKDVQTIGTSEKLLFL